MSTHNSPEPPKEPLGKLVYRQDDLNSLKCLVAIRMSRDRFEAVPTVDKKVETTLTLRSGETVTDPFAIAWFLASCDPKVKLPANHGVKVMQWQSFSNSEIRPFLQGLVKEGHLKYRDRIKANTMRKVRLIAGLDTLNQKLMESRFLDGNRMSLADALMAVDLTPILDPGWPIKKNPFLGDVFKKDYAYVREWYSVIRSKTVFENAFKQFIIGLPHGPNSPNVNEPKQPGEGGDSAAESAAVADGDQKAAGKKAGGRPRKTSSNSKKGTNDKPEAPDMSSLAAKPLRVLCLHGYRQNDVSFKEKTGAFRKLVGKYCEFTFIKAPHHVLPMSNEDINQDQRGWWFSRENDYFKADDASDCDKGFDGSLDLIQKTFELHGPFDGIIGFSQGAALLALLCLMKARNPEMLSPAVKFDFAVMVAAFKSKSSKHAHWYTEEEGQAKVTIPTLHVVGFGDRVIRKHLSEDLFGLFDQPDKIFHQGGHYVPATSRQKFAYYRFLHKVGQMRDGGHQPVQVAETPDVQKSKPLDKNQNQGCDVKQVSNSETTENIMAEAPVTAAV